MGLKKLTSSVCQLFELLLIVLVDKLYNHWKLMTSSK